MMRSIQAIYDFFLDLTGVRVGTYRAIVFAGLQIALGATDGLKHGMLGFVVGVPYGVLLAAVCWFALSRSRARAKTDNRDQEAGRLRSVNLRAMADQQDLPFVVGVLGSLLLILDVWLLGACGCFSACAFTSVLVHECLLVRDRDVSRFAGWMQPKMQAGFA